MTSPLVPVRKTLYRKFTAKVYRSPAIAIGVSRRDRT
jgi:hypothetical protein